MPPTTSTNQKAGCFVIAFLAACFFVCSAVVESLPSTKARRAAEQAKARAEELQQIESDRLQAEEDRKQSAIARQEHDARQKLAREKLAADIAGIAGLSGQAKFDMVASIRERDPENPEMAQHFADLDTHLRELAAAEKAAAEKNELALIRERLKDPDYPGRHDDLVRAVELAPADKALAKLKAASDRAVSIAAQFDDVTGEHKMLRAVVKLSMHDPESYDHAGTKWKDEGKVVRVTMLFRARNPFGAKVLNEVVATVDPETGMIVKIISEGLPKSRK